MRLLLQYAFHHSFIQSSEPQFASGRPGVCFSFAVEDEPWTAPAPPVLHNGVVDYYELLGVSFLPTNMLDTAKLLSFCFFDHKGQGATFSL